MGSANPITPPFFLAQTGHEWVATLRFLVKRGTFPLDALAEQLALRPFHESRTPVLSSADRVAAGEVHGAMQEVILTVHSAADLATDAFDAFLVKAAISYQKAFGVVNPSAPTPAEAAAEAPGWKVVPPPPKKAKRRAKI